MCHRITPLTMGELRRALEDLGETGRARVPREPASDSTDAYPGTQLPLFTVDEKGDLGMACPVWGFEGPSGPGRLVFNTRIETALSQARSGRGMWAGPILRGRCLVPVRTFWEWSDRRTEGRREQVRFTLPGHGVFLLAGVCDGERASVVTTVPNADMASHHSRMPLVLGPGESATWLGQDWASLADRSAIRLAAHDR